MEEGNVDELAIVAKSNCLWRLTSILFARVPAGGWLNSFSPVNTNFPRELNSLVFDMEWKKNELCTQIK